MLRPKFASMVYLVAAVLLPSYSVLAQNNPPAAPQSARVSPDTQLLKALLDEVRQLRLEVEKNSLRQHQTQAILKGIEKQQDRIESVSQELEQLREKIQFLSNPGRYDEALKEVETAIREATDPQSRVRLALVYEDLRRSLERQKKSDQQELEQQRERERELDTRLRSEQAKLAEWQGQLEALEQEFVAKATETKKGGKR